MTGRPWNDDDLVIGGLVVLAGGLACGVGTVLLVRNNPGGSFAGSSTLGGVALLVAGWLAITVGLAVYRRHRASRFAILLIAAGFAWFIAEWINPAAGSSLVFTTGLLLYAACPPLVAHAALAYPRGRLRSPIEAVAVAAAYTGTLLVLGLGPALVFEPVEQGCTQCAANLVAITNDPQLVATLNRAGVRLGVVWAAALTGLSLWRVARSTPATRRATAAVLVPAIVYLGAVTATYLHSLERGVLSNDDVDRRLWLIQAGSLTFVALGTIIEWVRARRARAAVAEMVVRLAEAPPPGGLRAALATTLGDPDLQIAYPVLDGHHVDADANPVAPVAGPGRATTALVHDGDTIAVLIHRDDLLGDPKLVEQAAAAAQLALENERLHAQAQAQLVDLRASRARLVDASDHERRRLERDLHDGAQQHLVGVTLALRLIRTRLEQADSPTLATRCRGRRNRTPPGRQRTTAMRIRDPSRRPHRLRPVRRHPSVSRNLTQRPAARHPRQQAAPRRRRDGRLPRRCRSNQSRTRQRHDHALRQQAHRRRRRRRRARPRRRPRRPPRCPRRHDRNRADSRWSAHPGGDPMRVVIADDSMIVREGLSRLLSDSGCDVAATARRRRTTVA